MKTQPDPAAVIPAEPGIDPAPPAITVAPPPAQTTAHVTPGWDRIRVVDAATGEVISHVVAADADAGTLTVFKVQDGAFVRDGDDFALESQARAIRLEWIDAA